jgi:hypothetical protein
VESRRKRRPDFLIRILERDTEDALGDLCLGVEVLDIVLDERTWKVAFRSMVGDALWRRSTRVAMMNQTELRADEQGSRSVIDSRLLGFCALV